LSLTTTPIRWPLARLTEMAFSHAAMSAGLANPAMFLYP